MPRNYRVERDGLIQRWYGSNPQPGNPRPNRTWAEDPITPADCLGIPTPVNLPFMALGHCMAWKYGLNQYGYGILSVDGKQEQAHRVVFIQTQGPIPEGKQVNHLCNRPYCVQPAHLYAGTRKDNRDDSRIFQDPDLITAPRVMHFPQSGEEVDPLVQRLRERGNNWDVEPWEPVEQPPQLPLEEFTCPEHDFAITMQGGDCLICKICEISQLDVEMAEGIGPFELIEELWPASQTVTPVFEKITRSEFLGESFRELRQKAYHRNDRASWHGAHDLRKCPCIYCARDRQAFRDALGPLLTREESDILDICDRRVPRIAAALLEASGEMMEVWATEMGMTESQGLALREHVGECLNLSSELTRTSRTIESDFAYLLYALVQFQDREEMGRDPGLEMVMLRWDNLRLRKTGREPGISDSRARRPRNCRETVPSVV